MYRKDTPNLKQRFVLKKMSLKDRNENTSDVARDIHERLKAQTSLRFMHSLNKKLKKACHVQVGLKANFSLPGYRSSYLVFVLLKDDEIVSHISCIEYLREGVFLVALNSFTSEAHRRRHYNLLLRAVALAVITMLYEGMPMKVYSSIANYMSLQAIAKYFKVETYNRDSTGEISSVLLDGRANQQQVASVLENFLAKCAQADRPAKALTGGSFGPAWAHGVGTLRKDNYNRTWVVKRLSPHGPGKTWVLASKQANTT